MQTSENQQHGKRNSARNLNCINIYSKTVRIRREESRLLLNVYDDERFETQPDRERVRHGEKRVKIITLYYGRAIKMMLLTT